MRTPGRVVGAPDGMPFDAAHDPVPVTAAEGVAGPVRHAGGRWHSGD